MTDAELETYFELSTCLRLIGGARNKESLNKTVKRIRRADELKILGLQELEILRKAYATQSRLIRAHGGQIDGPRRRRYGEILKRFVLHPP